MIIAALRTPVCRANGALKHLRSHELLAPVLTALLAETGLDAGEIADVVIGNAVGAGGNVARLAALEAGLPVTVPGLTVDRQCGSGLDAIVLASRLVAAGGGTYLAGGVESISTAPLRAHRNDDGEPAFFSRAQFAPHSHGDPDMGVAAENVAREYGISRARQDEFALRSHRRAVTAQAKGTFAGETVALPAAAGPGPGASGAVDDGPRPKLSEALMARFPAAFVESGTVTAGNSCFDADGAAAVVITSLARARELGTADALAVLGTDTAGVEPQLLGIGAAAAAARLLTAQSVDAADVDLVEFNEAFASQTLACLDHLGIDALRANADGGALALGHAYGASGAVLVTRLLAQARQEPAAPEQGKLALAMISIAGGMGTAALFRHIRL
ncbi:putative acetyl-CoA acetyltransferase [Arthrobacter globiformis NBRC 12137]|uniref:Putative acetyl-CoA acetyltransferase n=1 Tax=Arthrobacter globiformis (strain ATCC 8010 / DSM 20124 / JCM 1332 / NBRC 12137 / NCIMB 8907 / NRRL B-2979 / 168) TaxID=1077972 RepID=H0QIG3_ARTG1|nr:putative acetyl-CoA acetyltransferase [Arthrobacter globiformis NBRC 12137]